MRMRTAGRGTAMLEFALILPFVVAFMILVVDFGRIALTYTALQDATAASARAVARTGKVGAVGSGACAGTTPLPQNIAMFAFCNAIDTVPWVLDPRLDPTAMEPMPNGYCSQAGYTYVTMRASAHPKLILWDYIPEDWVVEATAVARCEVGR